MSRLRGLADDEWDAGFGPGADLAFSVLAILLAMLAAVRLTSITISGDTDLSLIHQEKVSLATAIREACHAPTTDKLFEPGGLTKIQSSQCSLQILDNPQFQTLIFNEGVLFPTKRSNLSAGGYQIVTLMRRTLQTQADNIVQIQILGHTDSVGGEADNLKLGSARALAVFSLLTDARLAESSGLNPLSMLISVTTYGYYDPVQRKHRAKFSSDDLYAANSTPSLRALNRRIELNIFFKRSPDSS